MNPVGVILIIFGLLMIPRKTIEWTIKFNNKVRGVKTEISKTTVFFYRLAAILFIILGIFGLFLPQPH